MRYWDSSALVPLLVSEPLSTRSEQLLRSDPDVVTFWASRVECASALNRLFREGGLSEEALAESLSGLETLASSWIEIQPTEKLRSKAMRLLRVHPLRTADALQLAAALIAADDTPSALTLITNDSKLSAIAAREGFETP